MKVEQTRGTNIYKFSSNDNKLFYMIQYESYPSCCLMGILHNFQIFDHLEFTKHKKEVQDWILGLMEEMEKNQFLAADTKDGMGYPLFENMDNCQPVNVVFNKNSGNCVYMFAIYQSMGM